MRAHVIEVGPNAIRRLCCGVGCLDDNVQRVALESLDDPIALVDRQPVATESLWRAVFESIDCGGTDSVVVIHPTWWSPSRVAVVGAAAQVLGGDPVIKPRSWLLRQASRAPVVIVEITDAFVVVTGHTVTAETRHADLGDVVDAVVHAVLSIASTATVVVDAPRTVRGAGDISALLAKELQDAAAMTVLQIDDIEFRKLAGGLALTAGANSVAAQPHSAHRIWKLGRAMLTAAVVLGVVALCYRGMPTSPDVAPTTYLVEGHVALEVPARWPVQRVVIGPGSARVQISSPSEPETALHVTQSRVALTDLAATAEFIRGAIDAAPDGVFVDFDPAGRSAGRTAVTYRERRSGHDIRWTVWVDQAVRISIGCQSRPGDDDAVRQECDLAVRTARAVI